jgi:hypothetical protein
LFKSLRAQAFLYRLTPEREASQGEARVRFGVRLGEHSWLPLAAILRNGAADAAFINTALLSVVLPPAFARDLDQIVISPTPNGVGDLVQHVIAALFAGIRASVPARAALTPALQQYHPVDPSSRWPSGTSTSAAQERARRFKISLFRYWIEALAWALRNVRPEAIGAVSYALVRALEPVRDFCAEPGVTVEAFQDLALQSLTLECVSHFLSTAPKIISPHCSDSIGSRQQRRIRLRTAWKRSSSA